MGVFPARYLQPAEHLLVIYKLDKMLKQAACSTSYNIHITRLGGLTPIYSPKYSPMHW